MNIAELIKSLADAGVKLFVENGKLNIKAPKGAVTPQMLDAIKERKAELIVLLGNDPGNSVQIPVIDRSADLPLSYSQRRLWLLDQIEGGSAHYNIPSALRLRGPLDHVGLHAAFHVILERHEVLRTRYMTNASGDPVQCILDADTANGMFSFPVSDLSALDDKERLQNLREAMREERDRPFDLANDLMLRGHLLRLGQDDHVLLVTAHHIASDGWSTSILIKELCAIYQSRILGLDGNLPALPIQYADYAHWQQASQQAEVLAKQLAYWEAQLADLPAIHQLPLDYERPTVQGYAGSTFHQNIGRKKLDSLQDLCKRFGATLFMGLHAVFAATLSRCSNESDIVVGTPVANRQQEQVGGLIGFFVNTLVLRSDVSRDIQFQQLLQQSRDMLLSAYDHQQVPFEKLVERLQPARVSGYSPLFQVMLVMQNNEVAEFDLHGMSLERVEQESNQVKFDLTLAMSESVEGLALSWEYNSDLWQHETVENMAERFERLLDAMLMDVSAKVMEAELLSIVEQRRLIDAQTQTARQFDDKCQLHDLVEAQAAREPGQTALITDTGVLSYGELNARANRLARHLREVNGVIRGDIVAICLERSYDMFVAILAVLKAGAAYLPMDPEYPKARLDYVIGDAAPKSIISTKTILAELAMEATSAVQIDSPSVREAIDSQSAENLPRTMIGGESKDIAYVIYTSGSTGAPKGSMLSHRSLCNLSAAQLANFDIKPESRILQFASVAFDAATWEIAMAWPHGAALVLLDPENAKQPQKVSETVLRHGVTHATLPPVLLPMLDEQFWQSVQTLIVAGEACALSVAEKWVQGRRFFNAYGPSETTVCATIGQYVPGQRVMHIGKPIQNVQVYVHNCAGRLVPEGTPGELYIGGAGLSAGYLNRPELTASRFVANPYYESGENCSSEKLYRTGDLVRWLPDGNLEFLGRIDQQIKIRGFRVEPGEIESVLLRQEGVRDVLVLAKGEGADKRLNAYLVTAVVEGSARTELEEKLRAELGKEMPQYMIPSAFILLDSYPLTANGKVDRKALLALEDKAAEQSYQAPESEQEQFLCTLGQEILGIERMGVSDNFFHRGGHSLSATKYIARINQHYQTGIPIRALFQAQTVRELAHIVDQATRERKVPPIEAIARTGRIPLSYGQQRLWMLDQIDGGSAHYNMPAALKLTGELEYQVLEQALQALVERHESLRTCIKTDEEGHPYASIGQAQALKLKVTDLTAQAPGERQISVAQITAEEASQSFDLQHDLMLRAQLLKLQNQEHILLVTMHHIASDGWSMSILINEMSALYKAHKESRPNPLPPLALQYADYAHWQRQWLQGDVLEQHHAYWQEQLRGLPLVHGLPLDQTRPKIQTFNGALHSSRIETDTLQALQKQCQAHGATLFMGLHAAFSVLLSRYSNEHDIVVGTPIANRERAELAGLIGFFVNTLVLRSDLTGSPSYATLLEQSKRTLLDAYTNQQLPFEHLVERLQPERSLSHSPLFQILLVLQNNDEGELDLPGLTLSPVEGGNTVAKYDLTLTVAETAGRLELGWEYNADLFESETIERMAQHFGVLLESLCSEPDTSVHRVPMMAQDEERHLLQTGRRESISFENDHCIHERFEAMAQERPDAIAVACGYATLTYRELNERANRLAHHLVAQRFVGPDVTVGLCVERSLDMMIAIMAILKAGGAYVPLDPAHPLDRLQSMIAIGKIGTVLTHRHLPLFAHLDRDVSVVMDDPAFLEELIRQDQSQNVQRYSALQLSEKLVYVIYTSGSTGEPKGVMVERTGFRNLISWYIEEYAMTSDDSVLVASSFGFDLTQKNLIAPLVVGAKLVLLDTNVYDPIAIHNTIADRQITFMNCAPSAFYGVIDAAADSEYRSLTSLRCLLFGGEPINDRLLAPWLKSRACGVEVVNMYGPTECTDIVTAQMQGRNINGHCIGKPIPNVTAYVLNPELQLCHYGGLGELYVSGIGLGRGYLNRNDLTEQAFISNPYWNPQDPISRPRMYKTGDMVRWLPDGSLEFLGRVDHQVKIRGMRIELGEIEQRIKRIPDIRDAIVMAQEIGTLGKQLVAYVVEAVDDSVQGSHSDDGVVCDLICANLEDHLPDYMIPRFCVVMEEFPLTKNGKVDRRALPVPAASQSTHTFVAPATGLEDTICEIWKRVLNLESVGRNDDFFKAGGHSLLAVQMLGQIKKATGYDVTLRVLFGATTVAEFAKAISLQDINPGQSNLVAIRKIKAPGALPLFLIHPGEGDVGYAGALAKHLDQSIAIYAFSASGFGRGETPHHSVEAMAAAYIRGMREVQKQGPYHIGGWSAGGTIAFEMGRQLIQAGERVAFLGLIDTSSDYAFLEAVLTQQYSGNPMVEKAIALVRSVSEQLPHHAIPGLEAVALQGNVERVIEALQVLGAFPGDLDRETLMRHVDVRVAIMRALYRYEIARADLPLSYFAAKEGFMEGRMAAWRDLTTQAVALRIVEGSHYSMMEHHNIPDLALAIQDSLSATIGSVY